MSTPVRAARLAASLGMKPAGHRTFKERRQGRGQLCHLAGTESGAAVSPEPLLSEGGSRDGRPVFREARSHLVSPNITAKDRHEIRAAGHLELALIGSSTC